MKRARWGLGFFLSGGMLAGFAMVGLLVVGLVHYYMRAQALVEAEAKAMILLDRTMAIHEYFSVQLKPHLFAITDVYMPKGYFDPVWMSSTHANRQINAYFNARSSADYYYKDAAVNARSPQNEADDFERQFIEELNRNPRLTTRSSVHLWNGQPYFFVLRRGERMDAACLRCHSTPAAAPQRLVELYGPSRSFDRKAGEVISAVSIRIPLAAAYAHADRVAWRLSALLLVLLAALFGLHLLVNRRFVLDPLGRMRDKARQITEDAAHLGDEVVLPQSRELQELAVAFNAMSRDLRDQRDGLEEQVADRTAALRAEIVERQRYQEESEQLIVDLQKALDEVKTLSGLLPICSFCKKIRDDQGYWEQMEAYLRRHSGAQFSHGICPECLRKNYPDFADKER
jgi:HAMP domain-containing protein